MVNIATAIAAEQGSTSASS